MTKRTILRHCVAALAILFFGVLSLASSCSSIPVPDESIGVVLDVPTYEKPFTSLGMVFVTSTVSYNSEGKMISNSAEEEIRTMLLREAHARGADNIYNYRLDEYIVVGKRGTGKARTVIYTGSAMAVKYLDDK